jgi:hypothetical protein
MKLKHNKLIPNLFVFFFFLILGLTLLVWYNNQKINEIAVNTYSQVGELTNLIVIDSLTIPKESKLLGKANKQKIVVRIDTIGIDKRIDQIQIATKKLDDTKRYILDANTITYLIQILCFFLIGIQIFISNKNENKVAKIEKKFKGEKAKLEKFADEFNKLIELSSNSSSIINSAEAIHFYSSQLNKKISEDEAENICHSISNRLFEIIDLVKKTNKWRPIHISSLASKHSLSLLHDVERVFRSKNYHNENGYFKDIYIRLLNTIDLINEMEVSEQS